MVPKPLDESKYEIVDTEEGLMRLIATLQSQSVFSFDIHEHTIRSYLGFICAISVHDPNSAITSRLARTRATTSSTPSLSTIPSGA